MSSELGPDQRSNFSEFNPIVIAAASIGQDHSATLASNKMLLAIKVQHHGQPSMLLTASTLLPKGFSLDSTLEATKAELEDECDYVRGRTYTKVSQGT
jgi:aarF domain-containing kinase